MKLSRLLGATALAGSLMFVPAVAFAQDESAQSDTATEEDGPIVVTGTRIPLNTYNTSSPVDVITRDDTILAGARSPAETLQSATITSGTSQINGNFLGFVSEGGPAANTVGLRGLGSQRTLVLLNGRRLAPAGAGPQLVSADLNVLPNAVLSRIEVLREGASSVYGSDAVAGVINLITDTKYNGVTLDAYTNQPFDTPGKGGTYRASIVAGKTWDRGHIMASVEYRELTGLRVGDREDFSCPTDYIFHPTTKQQIGQLKPDGSGLRCFPFQNGAVGTAQNYVLGLSFTTGAVNRYAYGNGNINTPVNVNNFNLRPLASQRQLEDHVYSPIQTYTGYLNGAYELGIGDIEIYGEALFTRRKSHQNYSGQISIDPQQIGFEIYGGSYAGTPLEAYGYPVSPFFPNSLASPANGQNNLLRVFIVPPLLTTRQEVDYFRGNGGFRGSVTDRIRFDANFMYSRTDATYSVQNIDTRRLRASLQPVLAPAGTPDQFVTIASPGQAGAGGRYTCASNLTGGAYNGGNCVAANFFDPATLAGDVPANLFNYLYSDQVATTDFEQFTGQLVFSGELFDLPAGPLGFAIGGEFRHDRILDVPSEAAQTGNLYNYSSGGITAGSDAVWEFFGEVNIPLLKDKPFAKELSISGSARYTHYRSYGSGFTYHVGANYAPAEFIRFRGSYGTSFRAPNLYEQFVADQSGFYGAGADPCDEFASVADPASNRYKNCLADLTTALGSPAAALAFVATGGPEVKTIGGAGNLEAEKSKSWGLGAVFQTSSKFGNISFAADYFNVTVNGEVSLLNTTILDRCYDSSEFRSGNIYCSFIAPRETVQGNLDEFDNPYLNIASQKASGIDFSLRYSNDVGPGNLVVNARATRMIHQKYQPFAEEAPFDYNGTLGSQGFAGGPKWVGDLDIRYKVDKITFRWGVDYVGKMVSNQDDYTRSVVNGVVADYDLRTGSYMTHDASIQFNWENVGQITFGVTNLFNRKPEKVSQTASGAFARIGDYFNYSGYDFLGRSGFVNVTKKF